eukprot:scaffold194987_cov25-Tisochrysis_lutea.AAC.2
MAPEATAVAATVEATAVDMEAIAATAIVATAIAATAIAAMAIAATAATAAMAAAVAAMAAVVAAMAAAATAVAAMAVAAMVAMAAAAVATATAVSHVIAEPGRILHLPHNSASDAHSFSGKRVRSLCPQSVIPRKLIAPTYCPCHADSGPPICRDFQRGTCSRGAGCRYSHGNGGGGGGYYASRPPMPEKKAGVCFDFVVRFLPAVTLNCCTPGWRCSPRSFARQCTSDSSVHCPLLTSPCTLLVPSQKGSCNRRDCIFRHDESGQVEVGLG